VSPSVLPLEALGGGWGPTHPAFVYLAGALAVALLGERRPRSRSAAFLVTPVLGLVALAGLAPGTGGLVTFYNVELAFLRVDRLSLFFALVCQVAAVLGAVYAVRSAGTTEQVAALGYVGASIAAVLAADLLSLFFAWEAMTVASAFLVFARRGTEAVAAGVRYLLVQLLSGLLLLGGALLAYHERGSLVFDTIVLGDAWTWMLLVAFGIKCGFPILHTWIVDAYPRATATGTVFLSMLTTKVAVYALARGFAGTELLVTVGVVMTVFPIFYAVIENDLRRVLGYSMINQLGFMVVGIGVGTELAMNGAVAHALNEVLFKGLLFMAMGAVLLEAGTVKASELGGLYRTMPQTATLCTIGALAISAFPLFNAFVSKGMILSAVLHEGHVGVWYALLFASAGVFHHAGIKVPFFAFFWRDAGIQAREPPLEMRVAMTLAAAGCVLLGMRPELLTALLPWPAGGFEPYSYAHVLLQMQLLLFSALAFATLKLTHLYPDEIPSVNLDADWLVRRPGRMALQWVDRLAGRSVATARAVLGERATSASTRVESIFGARGLLARGTPLNTSMLIVALALLGSLLVQLVPWPM
jgi:multicomponent Na+:H+ antiporter subunit D